MNSHWYGAICCLMAVIGVATSPSFAQSSQLPAAFALRCDDSEDLPPRSTRTLPEKFLCGVVDDAVPIPLGYFGPGELLSGQHVRNGLSSISAYVLTGFRGAIRRNANTRDAAPSAPPYDRRARHAPKTKTATGNPGGGLASGRRR